MTEPTRVRDITISDDDWMIAGDNADHLTTILVINGTFHHLEAIRIHEDDGRQHAASPEFEEIVDAMFTIGGDGPFDTVYIKGESLRPRRHPLPVVIPSLTNPETPRTFINSSTERSGHVRSQEGRHGLRLRTFQARPLVYQLPTSRQLPCLPLLRLRCGTDLQVRSRKEGALQRFLPRRRQLQSLPANVVTLRALA